MMVIKEYVRNAILNFAVGLVSNRLNIALLNVEINITPRIESER